MNNPIIMHVNYCEQGQTIEEMCKKAVKWGFDGIEFRAKRNGVEETREDYIDEVAKAQKVSGLKYVLFSLNMVNVMDPCAEKRKAAEDDAIDFMKKAAAKIKCTTFNAFAGGLFTEDDKLRENWSNNGGNGAARGCHWRWATESYKRIGAEAEKLGIKIAFETHMNYLHDTPANAYALCEMINCDAVGLLLDYGNAVYFRNNPSLKDTILSVKDKIYDTHLKNSIKLSADPQDRMPTALGGGEINHREYIKLLKQIGYTGPITIEAPRPGDREAYAVEDLAYIKKVIEEVEAE